MFLNYQDDLSNSDSEITVTYTYGMIHADCLLVTEQTTDGGQHQQTPVATYLHEHLRSNKVTDAIPITTGNLLTLTGIITLQIVELHRYY